MPGLVLYAPSVHTGGGFVLLRSLLSAWPSAAPLTAWLDARARAQLVLPQGIRASWVAPTPAARLRAEIDLRRATIAGETVLCFHGLPPLLASRARVIVFQQNRIHLGSSALGTYRWKTRVRLGLERFVARAFRHRVNEYLVQTPSMQRAVERWYGARPGDRAPTVRVLPFAETLPAAHREAAPQPAWDFVYVADGEAHKNHRSLLQAWQLLAEQGEYPSLALTLATRDEALRREIASVAARSKLRILNLGQCSHEDVLALYSCARALIFPSISESFGLPLVEATRLGLPIVASELDFVRDVCEPTHTFDATSPVSIARAVKRFLGRHDGRVEIRTPAQFWDAVLSDGHP